MRRVGGFPLIADPGIWRYHTSSDILGVLIARVAGQSLETVLREWIFRPLGMVDTSFTVPQAKRDRLTVLYGPAPDFAVLDHPRDTAWTAEPLFASPTRRPPVPGPPPGARDPTAPQALSTAAVLPRLDVIHR
ncbi:serine hydrolase domain-containing protein [Nocardia sp. NPDC052112]|uniref:serine hydrolase domain-containing protein n=1 Tax=Nocardia sp. NPDC052112 TaxID=3155646 RepID=UPI00341ED10B